MSASMKKRLHVEYESSDSGSDADLEHSDEEIDEEHSSHGDQDGNPSGKSGLADVMAKILQKKIPVHQQVILAKGKTDKEIKKRKLETETEDGASEKKPAKGTKKVENVVGAIRMAQQEKMKLWENMYRSKPNPLDKDKERQFQRIATRGVVQLFNAVRKQQKDVEEEMGQVGSSERRREKVMQGMTKDKFLNILKGSSTTNVKMDPAESVKKVTKPKKAGSTDDKNQQWSILRDDYMMGAKMKDWNKGSSDEEGEDSGPGDPDMSDSD